MESSINLLTVTKAFEVMKLRNWRKIKNWALTTE